MDVPDKCAEALLAIATSGSTGFEEAVTQEVSRQLRAVASDIRRCARNYGGNIEVAMLDIAEALEEACESAAPRQEPVPGCTQKEWADLQRVRKHYGFPELPVPAMPPLNIAEAVAGPEPTSRCCNAPVSSCDGRPLCSKCRLTGRV